jgi:hypothetical protein
MSEASLNSTANTTGEWCVSLGASERKIVLASIVHNTTGHDFDLSEPEWALAEGMYADLQRSVDGQDAAGHALLVAEADRMMLLAMMSGYVHDVHQPVDALTEAEWARAEEIQGILNVFDDPSQAIPSPGGLSGSFR